MGKSNTETLKIAEKYLGCGGSKFRKFCGLPSWAAWCNAFVDEIFYEAGNASLFCGGKKITYCPTSMSWCSKNLAQIPIYLALPGDVVYFDWEPNGVPNHIGFARKRESAVELNTIEGNTGNSIVAYRTRPVKYICGCYRPHYIPGSFIKTGALKIDGEFGYGSISMLQKALNVKQDAILGIITVKALQKRAGVKQDGSWGPNTTKAVQKLIGTKVDGYFGPNSVKALQMWINAQNKVTSVTKAPAAKTPVVITPVKKTKAQEINDNALKFAWPAGTKESIYKYSGGKADPDFIKAWKKYFPKSKINCGCHQFVNLVLKACGYKGFSGYDWKKDILPYLKKNFTEIKVNYKQSQLKPGDIRVHKNSSGGYHIWVIVEKGGKFYRAEANQVGNKRYAHLNASTSGNTKKHKADWLFRAK